MDYVIIKEKGNDIKETTTKGKNMGPNSVVRNTIIRMVEVTNTTNRIDLRVRRNT